MHHLTRTLCAVLAALVLCSACGGEDPAAARAKKLEDARAALKAHKATWNPGWQAEKNKLIPAKRALDAAKGTSEEAALREAYAQLKAHLAEIEKEEAAWNARERELKDLIYKLER